MIRTGCEFGKCLDYRDALLCKEKREFVVGLCESWRKVTSINANIYSYVLYYSTSRKPDCLDCNTIAALITGLERKRLQTELPGDDIKCEFFAAACATCHLVPSFISAVANANANVSSSRLAHGNFTRSGSKPIP